MNALQFFQRFGPKGLPRRKLRFRALPVRLSALAAGGLGRAKAGFRALAGFAAEMLRKTKTGLHGFPAFAAEGLRKTKTGLHGLPALAAEGLRKAKTGLHGLPALAAEGLRRLARSPAARGAAAKRAAALASAAAVTVGAVLTGMAAARQATVTVDGAPKSVRFFLDGGTDAILKKAGVTLEKDSLLSRSDDGGSVSITIRTPRRVTVAADGEERTVLLHSGDTAGDALKAAGVAAGADDKVEASQAAGPLKDGARVEVVRGLRVSVSADGRTTDSVVYGGTVAQALAGAGVAVDSDDVLSAGPQEAVRDGMKIAVTRVEYKDVTEVRPVPYRTVTQKDASLAAGKTVEKKAGQNGEKTVVTRRKLVGGKATESAVVRETVTKQPVDRVVAVGTKAAAKAARKYGTASISAGGTLTDHNGRQVAYKKLLQGRCSTYTGGGTTSTGRKAAFGLVAVNPKIIPYGSRLYICSPDGRIVYGYAVAADTGGAAMRNIIIADLYFDTYRECTRIGTRTMNVYVL